MYPLSLPGFSKQTIHSVLSELLVTLDEVDEEEGLEEEEEEGWFDGFGVLHFLHTFLDAKFTSLQLWLGQVQSPFLSTVVVEPLFSALHFLQAALDAKFNSLHWLQIQSPGFRALAAACGLGFAHFKMVSFIISKWWRTFLQAVLDAKLSSEQEHCQSPGFGNISFN